MVPLIATSRGRETVHEPWQRQISDDEELRWWRTLPSLPYANTIETKSDDVGTIHAGPAPRNWTRTVADLARRTP